MYEGADLHICTYIQKHHHLELGSSRNLGSREGEKEIKRIKGGETARLKSSVEVFKMARED